MASHFTNGAAYFVGRLVGRFTEEQWRRMLRAVGEQSIECGCTYSIEEVLERFNRRLEQGWKLVPPEEPRAPEA